MSSQYVNRWAFEDGDSPTFDSSSDTWDFNPGSDIVKTQPLINAQGLAGTRVKDVSRSRLAPYTVGGTLTIEPSPAFFGSWLPRVMGGGTATAPTLEDALLVWGALSDRGEDVYKHLGCVVNRFTLSGRAGGLIECSLDVLGKTEEAGATFTGAALGSTAAYEPYQHADLACTLVAAARNILDFRFVLDNAVTAGFANSLSANRMITSDRIISLEANVVFDGDSDDLYGLAKNGAAGSIVLTNGACSTTFTLGRVQIPDNSPRTQNGEIVLPIRAQIRGASWGDEFTVTNDQTP